MLKKIAIAAVVLGAAGYAAFQLSPWPSALFFRVLMDQGGHAAARALEKHVPAGVTARLGERYDAGDADALFDIFYPSSVEKSDRTLPTIVWVHGGGFISGSSAQITPYLKILAARGFTVVGVNYSLAPGATYPTPIRQVNAALAYLQKNAARLHIDPSKLILAGDSAGAQIAGQMANIISAPTYAKAVGVVPAIGRDALLGVILHCGFHDPHNLRLQGRGGGFARSTGWSYFGVRDFEKDPRLSDFSVVRNVTRDFPPMFISVGNADPLEPHSRLLAETAAKLGVPVDSLFFQPDYEPRLPHEYQFNLNIEAGRIALERTLKFLAARLQPR